MSSSRTFTIIRCCLDKKSNTATNTAHTSTLTVKLTIKETEYMVEDLVDGDCHIALHARIMVDVYFTMALFLHMVDNFGIFLLFFIIVIIVITVVL